MHTWESADLVIGTTQPMGDEDAWYLLSLHVEEFSLKGTRLEAPPLTFSNALTRFSSAYSLTCCNLVGSPMGHSEHTELSTAPVFTTTLLLEALALPTDIHAAFPKDAP